MTDLKTKTPEELQLIINEATAQLKTIQESKRNSVITQIKELAKSIGLTLDIPGEEKKISKRVGTVGIAKYRNPNDSLKTWTGQGTTPKWLKDLVAEGHDKSEYLIND